MRLVLKPLTFWSETESIVATNHAICRLICGGGLMLALSGCAGKVDPEIRYARVEVPVQVLCRSPEVEVPQWAADGLRKTDSLELKVRALLAERRQRLGYEKQLEAAVRRCK